MARILLARPLSVALAMLLVSVAGLVWLGCRVGLWNPSLIPETVVWYVGAALVLFFNLDRAASQEGFFRRAVLRTLELTLFVEFFVNLFVLSLPLELLLQFILVVLGLVSLVAGRDRIYSSAKKLADAAAATLGLALGAFVLVRLARGWRRLDPGDLLLEPALPIWMTVGVLLLLYLFAAYLAYDGTFRHVDFMVEDASARRRIKLALVLMLRGRLWDVAAFRFGWVRNAEAARSLSETTTLVRSFRAARGQR